MRIIFVDQQVSKPYTVGTPKKEPLGGSQSAICYYAEELSKLGHEVILLTHITNSIEENGIQHHPIQWYHDQRGFETDVIILCSAIFPTFIDNLERNFRYKLSICWQGHHGTEPLLSNASKYLYYIDLYAFVSDYQRNHFCRQFNLPYEKSILMLNGISPFFNTVDISNKSDRCIFFSNPQRGLRTLATIWPNVVKSHPNVKLDIFSSEKTYGQKKDNDDTLEAYTLLRKIPNVTVHEPAGQEHLANMCAQSAFLVYPTHFIETSCIVYLEASAAGALPLISDIGVFPTYDFECVHYGVDFNTTFTNKTIKALDNYYKRKAEYTKQSRERSKKIRSEHNYAYLAKTLTELFEQYTERKRFAITRLKEINCINNTKLNLFISESMPLLFENRITAANYFLQEGNRLLTVWNKCAAERAYKTSWDIIQSKDSCKNIFQMYNHLEDIENMVVWFRTYAINYGINFEQIYIIMRDYSKLKFIDRLFILEYIMNVVSQLNDKRIIELYADVTVRLSNVYSLLGKHNQSIQLYRSTINKFKHSNLAKANQPAFKTLLSNLIFTSNYSNKDEHYMEDCLSYEQLTEAPVFTVPSFSQQIQGKIKIGFLSGDFTNHPVTHIVNGFIEHINKDTFEVYIFNNAEIQEKLAFTYTLKHIKENINIHKLNVIDCVEEILARKIDILIDMCGHTSSSTSKLMDIVRIKPARIVANYFACPGTIALKAVDYKLGDAVCLPESSKGLFTEEFQYLAHGMHCYKPWGEYSVKKSENNGNIRFGVFNNPLKFSDQFRETIVSILKAVPKSTVTFVYYDYKDNTYTNILKRYFEERGISESRLLFFNTNVFTKYAALYNDIDITLDTFPYNGGTISIESFFLSTPYITLLGNDYVSRIGASIATQIGHTEFIVSTIDEYIQKAVGLATDMPRLAKYHTTLHDDVMRSTLGNGKLFAKDFESAMYEMLEKKGHKVNNVSVSNTIHKITIGKSTSSELTINLDRKYPLTAQCFVSTNPYNDTFDCKIVSDKLYVKRTDKCLPWAYPHTGIIVDMAQMPKFYVSLTTIPSRITTVHKSIASLFKQTFPPHKIILNIPNKYGFRFGNIGIPEADLDALKKQFDHRLIINKADQDYGPGTKLLGSLTVDIEEDAYIVLADDDVIYNDILHEYLPHLTSYNVMSKDVITVDGFSYGQGVNTILCKRSLLKNFHQYYKVLCDNAVLKHHDDLYISYYFRLLGETIKHVHGTHSYASTNNNVNGLINLEGEFSRKNVTTKSMAILNTFTREGRFEFLKIISNLCTPVTIGRSITNTIRIQLEKSYPSNSLFLLSRHRYSDKFDTKIVGNNLYVKRIDSEYGWDYPHTGNVVVSEAKLYVTLTTIPQRFNTIYKTIDSLLNQLYMPEKIIINVPLKYGFRFNNATVLDADINKMKKHYSSSNRLIINRVDNDYGPITKLLGALSMTEIDDNSYIVVADDDQIYGDWVLSSYLKRIDTNPLQTHSARLYSEFSTPIPGIEGWCTFMVQKKLLNGFTSYYDVLKQDKHLNYHDDMILTYFFYITGHDVLQIHEGKFIIYDDEHGLDQIQGEFSRANLNKKCASALESLCKESKFAMLETDKGYKKTTLASIKHTDIEFISIGPYCYTADLLKKNNLRFNAYPFDWIFSSLEMVEHCIRDRFQTFLNKDYLVSPPGGLGSKTQHTVYAKYLHTDILITYSNRGKNIPKSEYLLPDDIVFNHHDLLGKDYNTFVRRCDRFMDLIDSSKKICLVYYNAYTREFDDIIKFATYCLKFKNIFVAGIFENKEEKKILYNKTNCKIYQNYDSLETFEDLKTVDFWNNL